MHLTEALSQPTRAPVVCDASGSHFFVGSSPSLKISSRLTCAVPSSITPSSAAFLPSVVVVAALAAPPLALRTKYTSESCSSSERSATFSASSSALPCSSSAFHSALRPNLAPLPPPLVPSSTELWASRSRSRRVTSREVRPVTLGSSPIRSTSIQRDIWPLASLAPARSSRRAAARGSPRETSCTLSSMASFAQPRTPNRRVETSDASRLTLSSPAGPPRASSSASGSWCRSPPAPSSLRSVTVATPISTLSSSCPSPAKAPAGRP